MTFPYSVGIGPSTGSTPITVLTVFDSWNLARNLDDGCTFTFSCPGNSVPGLNLVELQTDIWLYYNSTLNQRFRVLEVTQSWGPNGEDSLQVFCVCYRRIFASRHVILPQVFPAVSQGDIVWGLIQHTQAQTNGNLGITLGTAGPTILRDREYPTGTKILEAISDLTRIQNGLTWEIDENLQLQISQPSAYPLNPTPIDLGVNALSLSRPSGAAQFGNVALAAGDSQTTTVQVSSSPTLAVDQRGRWERFVGLPTETVQANLQQTTEGLLQDINSPAIIWEAEIEPARFFSDSHYELGDFVTIVHPERTLPDALNPSQPIVVRPSYRISAQILTISLIVGNSGETTVRLSAVESPQRWDDVPSYIEWDDVAVGITWDSVATTYLV